MPEPELVRILVREGGPVKLRPGGGKAIDWARALALERGCGIIAGVRV